MENNNVENNVIVAKGKRGRKPKYDYIAKPDNDTDDQEVKAEPKQMDKYSSQYYQDHKSIKVICPICLMEVQKYSIGKHQKTKTCQMIKDFKDRYNTNT